MDPHTLKGTESCFSKWPIPSMYRIFTYIYHKNPPNVGKYASPMDAMGDVVSVQLISFLHDVFQHSKNGRPGDVPRRFFGRITFHVNGKSKLYRYTMCVSSLSIYIYTFGPPSYSDMKIWIFNKDDQYLTWILVFCCPFRSLCFFSAQQFQQTFGITWPCTPPLGILNKKNAWLGLLGIQVCLWLHELSTRWTFMGDHFRSRTRPKRWHQGFVGSWFDGNFADHKNARNQGWGVAKKSGN